MGLFDKLKAAVGVGQPTLNIKFKSTSHLIDPNTGKHPIAKCYTTEPIRLIVDITAQERATTIDSISAWVEHHYNLQNADGSTTAIVKEYGKTTIKPEEATIQPNETSYEYINIELKEDINLELPDSQFFVKAQADIPGLDATDKEPIELLKGVSTANWRERILNLKQEIEANPKYVVRSFEVGNPINDEATLQFLNKFEIHNDVKEFYKQINGTKINFYLKENEQEFYFETPQITDSTHIIMEGNHQDLIQKIIADNGVVGGKPFIFYNDYDNSTTFYVCNGMNTINFSTNNPDNNWQDPSTHNTLYISLAGFNEWLDAFIRLHFLRNFPKALAFHQFGNENYTADYSILKTYLSNLSKENSDTINSFLAKVPQF